MSIYTSISKQTKSTTAASTLFIYKGSDMQRTELIDKIDDGHKGFATDDQWAIVESVRAHGGSLANAGRAMQKDPSNMRKSLLSIIQRAAKSGYAPTQNHSHVVPEGYMVKGTSTLYKDGLPVLQWVKTKADDEALLRALHESINAMLADVPRLEPVPESKSYRSDCMALYPLGDPHIGMLSWGEESGQDWDLSHSQDVFSAVFQKLVETTLPCAEAVIINLGDYFHYDNMDGVTSRSGHSLDVDSRYAKMIRVGIKIMRCMITHALHRHRVVRVINAIGNHDDTGAMWLSLALANIYEHEPRVIIDASPAPHHYVRWGQCLVGIHHGHSTKPAALPLVMAADRSKDWGETDYRYWYCGHVHHDSKQEYAGVSVESFRTLAAKDAYAAWHGYRAGRDSKCIVLHRKYGEIERHTVDLRRAGCAA
jgi:hypothetical protein